MSQPKLNKIHHEFQLNGSAYDHKGLGQAALAFMESEHTFEKELGTFILDWLSPDSKIILQTSGTTGSPKKFPFDKQALVNSALTTGQFFNLLPLELLFFFSSISATRLSPSCKHSTDLHICSYRSKFTL